MIAWSLVVLLVGVAVLTHAWHARRMVWSRNTKALGWVVARMGDRGEEYRSGGGSWSSNGGAIYAERGAAVQRAADLGGAYVLPLRLDQRKGLRS